MVARISFLTPLLIAMVSATCLAGEKDWPTPLARKDGTLAVLAGGAGATREEALKDALRSAVQQVVQTMVKSETVTTHEKVIKNEVLTAAVGLVEGYQERSATQEAGVWRVQIIARVSDRKMTAQLDRAKVPYRKKDVDGEGLFAEAVTERQAERNTLQWLKHVAKDFPWDCIKAEVSEYKRLPERDTDTGVTINFKVKYSINNETYGRTATWLMEMLEPLAVQPSQPFTTSGRELASDYPFIQLPFERNSVPKFDRSRYCLFWVYAPLKETSRGSYTITGRRFLVPKSARTAFEDANYYSIRGKVEIQIRLLNKEGKLVKEHRRAITHRIVLDDNVEQISIKPDLHLVSYIRLWKEMDLPVVLPIGEVRSIARVEAAVVRKD